MSLHQTPKAEKEREKPAEADGTFGMHKRDYLTFLRLIYATKVWACT